MEVNGGGDDSRVYGYPTSRIVRVSRASGGKDRHSKVLTSKGLRDRRVRLSVSTAIQFYDLQDRLGYDQPSKAVEWLIKAAANSINELPSLDPSSFHDSYFNSKEVNNKRNKKSKFVDPNYNNSNSNNNNNSSSNSETSKGSGSLTRCENRIKARERARIMASKKENEKSFTDLLTSGISSTTESPMNYFCLAGDNFNFASSSTSSNGCGLGPGFIRETLQSNLMSSLPHHQIQRFQQSSMVDGSTSTNFPFFVAGASGHFPVTTGYDYRGGRYSDHHKEKSKN